MSSNVSAAGAAPAPPVAPVPAAAPAAAATPASPAGGITVAAGQVLAVTPGQELAARVIAAADGRIELALAGGVVTAASDMPAEPGQTLRLMVAEAGAERVTLRVIPDGAGAAGAAGAGGAGAGAGAGGNLAAALAGEGLPGSAATALLAALAEEGATPAPGGPAAALAARAAAAGVSTPAQAAAFARLEAAGLPTTPAAVAGLAQLMEGAPIGRALAALTDALAARTAGAQGAPVPAQDGAAGGASNWTQGGRAIAQPPTATPGMPLGEPVPGGGANWHSTPVPSGTAAAAAAADPSAEASLRALATALGAAATGVGEDAAAGHGVLLRRALAELGTGMEHRLHAGDAPERAPLRSLLIALADHPAADPALARAAGALADGAAAQPLAGATLPPPPGAQAQAQAQAQADTSAQNGAYLQLPLPGGGTAEVRVSPDGGRGGADGDRPRTVAFLLHLSALGPVLIEASAGPRGVDATVKASGEAAQAFLRERSGELSDALRRTSGSARVSVERLSGPPPERLLTPPPSSGLDLSA